MNPAGNAAIRSKGWAWMDMHVWASKTKPGLATATVPLVQPVLNLSYKFDILQHLWSDLNEPGRH